MKDKFVWILFVMMITLSIATFAKPPAHVNLPDQAENAVYRWEELNETVPYGQNKNIYAKLPDAALENSMRFSLNKDNNLTTNETNNTSPEYEVWLPDSLTMKSKRSGKPMSEIMLPKRANKSNINKDKFQKDAVRIDGAISLGSENDTVILNKPAMITFYNVTGKHYYHSNHEENLTHLKQCDMDYYEGSGVLKNTYKDITEDNMSMCYYEHNDNTVILTTEFSTYSYGELDLDSTSINTNVGSEFVAGDTASFSCTYDDASISELYVSQFLNIDGTTEVSESYPDLPAGQTTFPDLSYQTATSHMGSQIEMICQYEYFGDYFTLAEWYNIKSISPWDDVVTVTADLNQNIYSERDTISGTCSYSNPEDIDSVDMTARLKLDGTTVTTKTQDEMTQTDSLFIDYDTSLRENGEITLECEADSKFKQDSDSNIFSYDYGTLEEEDINDFTTLNKATYDPNPPVAGQPFTATCPYDVDNSYEIDEIVMGFFVDGSYDSETVFTTDLDGTDVSDNFDMTGLAGSTFQVDCQYKYESQSETIQGDVVTIGSEPSQTLSDLITPDTPSFDPSSPDDNDETNVLCGYSSTELTTIDSIDMTLTADGSTVQQDTITDANEGQSYTLYPLGSGYNGTAGEELVATCIYNNASESLTETNSVTIASSTPTGTGDIPYYIDDELNTWLPVNVSAGSTETIHIKKESGFSPEFNDVFEISLEAFYPFNGNAKDVTPNNNDGTVNGATLTSDEYGNPDSAYSFDGVDDYIDLPTIPLNNDISLITKMNSPSNTNTQWAINNYGGGSNENHFIFGNPGDNDNMNVFLDDGSTSEWIDSTETYKTGNYLTLGFTYTNTDYGIEFVKNGNTIHTATFSGANVDLDQRGIRIGSAREDRSWDYEGTIDFLRLYSSVISSTKREQLNLDQPTTTVTDMGNYYEVEITNNEATALQNYQIYLDDAEIGATSTTDSYSISYDTGSPEPPLDINVSLDYAVDSPTYVTDTISDITFNATNNKDITNYAYEVKFGYQGQSASNWELLDYSSSATFDTEYNIGDKFINDTDFEGEDAFIRVEIYNSTTSELLHTYNETITIQNFSFDFNHYIEQDGVVKQEIDPGNFYYKFNLTELSGVGEPYGYIIYENVNDVKTGDILNGSTRSYYSFANVTDDYFDYGIELYKKDVLIREYDNYAQRFYVTNQSLNESISAYNNIDPATLYATRQATVTCGFDSDFYSTIDELYVNIDVDGTVVKERTFNDISKDLSYITTYITNESQVNQTLTASCMFTEGTDSFIIKNNKTIQELPELLINTDAATNTGTTSATLNGEVTDVGAYSNIDVRFLYRAKSDSTFQSTPYSTITSPQQFSQGISGLDVNTDYEYLAQANASGTIFNGTLVDFSTTDYDIDTDITTSQSYTPDPLYDNDTLNILCSYSSSLIDNINMTIKLYENNSLVNNTIYFDVVPDLSKTLYPLDEGYNVSSNNNYYSECIYEYNTQSLTINQTITVNALDEKEEVNTFQAIFEFVFDFIIIMLMITIAMFAIIKPIQYFIRRFS